MNVEQYRCRSIAKALNSLVGGQANVKRPCTCSPSACAHCAAFYFAKIKWSARLKSRIKPKQNDWLTVSHRLAHETGCAMSTCLHLLNQVQKCFLHLLLLILKHQPQRCTKPREIWNSFHYIMTPLSHCRLLLVVTLALQVSSSCYYPDGTYIAADRPCITNGTQESFCCGSQGVTCLSDKVCYNSNASSGNEYVRGSCTDRSFQSSACPNFCLSSSV